MRSTKTFRPGLAALAVLALCLALSPAPAVGGCVLPFAGRVVSAPFRLLAAPFRHFGRTGSPRACSPPSFGYGPPPSALPPHPGISAPSCTGGYCSR